MKKYILCLLCLLSLCACAKSERNGTMVDTMTPIIDQNGADPWVFQKDGQYYYTKTTGNNVTLFRSHALSTVAWGEEKIVYTPSEDLQNLWAPEIHYLDNAWYIYFAANTPQESMHKMYVLKNESQDPFEGEWTCQPVQGMDDKFAIDGTVLETQAGRYFIWSGWAGYENVQQDLYLARMRSPEEIEPEKILISKPEYDWEKVGTPLVNEAPQAIVRENTINLTYSASGSWTDAYCVGLLTAATTDDLTKPENWKKEKQPILQSANGVYGPGHNGFAMSPDGTQTFMLYHAARWQGAGWSRSIRLQPIAFDAQGKLLPFSPITQPQPLPSGESKRMQFSPDLFTHSDGIQYITDPIPALQGFEDSQDTAKLSFSCAEDGLYAVVIYAKVLDVFTEDNGVFLSVKLDEETFKKPVFSSDIAQPICIVKSLQAGEHVLQLQSEIGVDCLSVERVELIAL